MPRNHHRVLIVEDEYYLGTMLAQSLVQEKIQALAVTEVDSAIDWLNKKKFDLVVSDIYLPGKNGSDLFNYVKEQQIEVPFVFMTGKPDLKMAVDFLTRGGYDYIVKPFMIPDFIKKIKSIIQVHQTKKKEKNLVKDLRILLSQRLEELKIYQDVFESTDDGVIITDLDGYIVKVNQGFEHITGISSIQLVQQHSKILKQLIFPGFDFGEVLEKLNSEKTWKGELLGRNGSDQRWYAQVTFSPIHSEESRIFAYAGIFKDVTAQRQVEQALITSLQKMNLAQEAIIFGLAQLAEQRDQNTGYHLERIRSYSTRLAEMLLKEGMYHEIITPDFIQMLGRTAPLHDIGKVGIPDYILLKKGKLTENEFKTMKSHTLIGYNILNSISKQYGDIPFINMGIELTYCHHERWDGTGYPRGLKGDEIPLSAQILAFADVYDAITTVRSYKDAYSHSEALKMMKAEKGKHFSPKIFNVFLDNADRFNNIREEFSENHE